MFSEKLLSCLCYCDCLGIRAGVVGVCKAGYIDGDRALHNANVYIYLDHVQRSAYRGVQCSQRTFIVRFTCLYVRTHYQLWAWLSDVGVFAVVWARIGTLGQ